VQATNEEGQTGMNTGKGAVNVEDVTESIEGEEREWIGGPAMELRFGPPLKSCDTRKTNSRSYDFNRLKAPTY